MAHAQDDKDAEPSPCSALTGSTPNNGGDNSNEPKFTLGKLTQTGLEIFFFSAANMNYLVFLK